MVWLVGSLVLLGTCSADAARTILLCLVVLVLELPSGVCPYGLIRLGAYLEEFKTLSQE